MPVPSPQTYYCRIRNCQRSCGLLHRDSSKISERHAFGQSLSLDREDPKREETKPPYNAPVQKRKKKVRKPRSGATNSTTSTSTTSSRRDSQITKESPSPQPVSTLNDIMERAVKKISAVKIVEDSTTMAKPKKSRTSKKTRLEPSVSLDTTTIHFDQPVWDNAELREELLDSEEEFALDADPPSLREDSLVVDDLLSETTHPLDSNPIEHGRKDEMISGWSSDENDFSNVDLTQTRKADSTEELHVIPVRRGKLKGMTYEQSLDLAENV